MSLTLTLIPLAIAINMSVTASATAIAASCSTGNKEEADNLPAVETIFMDSQMLSKTLSEHGLRMKTVSDSEYIIETEAGHLRYFRNSSDSPLLLEVSKVKDMDALLESLDILEREYGRNIQQFTYDKVKCSLAEHGMSVINEEVLEDDSILLTLSV